MRKCSLLLDGLSPPTLESQHRQAPVSGIGAAAAVFSTFVKALKGTLCGLTVATLKGLSDGLSGVDLCT
jgi:hypothetical protein